MAKIAYIGLPAHGHTNPTLPVMKALVQRGHEVLYYNAESFREKLRPTGVDFRPLPEPMPTEREVSEAMRELIDASVLLAGISPRLTRYMIDELGREKPDVVIYDSVAMWGYIAARTHGIPQICSITTFVLEGSVGSVGLGNMARFVWSALPHAAALMQWKQGMAREFGKENAGGITEYAAMNLVYTSKAFHPKNSFVDERFQFVGPSIDATTRDGSFPFEQLQDGTKVYISLGTITNLDVDFYQAVFSAFGEYPAQFILSVGKNMELASLGAVPRNFIVQQYVPQLDILQRVDAFITHGGMNSIHEGLYYGVPEIVVPQQFEQLLNGKRVAQTQTGLLLGETRPYGRVTVAELRTALEAVLNTPIYRENAARIGATLREAGGFTRAVEEIGAYIGVGERVMA